MQLVRLSHATVAMNRNVANETKWLRPVVRWLIPEFEVKSQRFLHIGSLPLMAPTPKSKRANINTADLTTWVASNNFGKGHLISQLLFKLKLAFGKIHDKAAFKVFPQIVTPPSSISYLFLLIWKFIAETTLREKRVCFWRLTHESAWRYANAHTRSKEPTFINEH